MDAQKVTADYRLSQWAQIIKTRLESGQNIKDFCQATGISKNAYFYWQRKLRNAACTKLARTEELIDNVPSGWMQLNSKQPQYTNESVDIEINGCHITVNAQTDIELLKKVCCTLLSL
jgi:putative transposase